MPTTATLSNAAKSAQADALARLLDNGYVDIYDVGDTLLARLTLSATSAPAAVNGLLTFNTITADSAVDASGDADYFELVASDGTTTHVTGTVGATGSGEGLELDDISLVQNGTCSVSSLTYQV